LSLCSHSGWEVGSCTHRDDVGVSCSLTDGQVRLVGGHSSRSGRVEIYHNNQWGTVCNRLFSMNEARVVCSQLGYPTSSPQIHSGGYYGEGNDTVSLDFVKCEGHESRLSLCSNSGWGIGKCTHEDYVGVTCSKYNGAFYLITNT
jgi:deleted-in-malignant-brain-tumors protein 1